LESINRPNKFRIQENEDNADTEMRYLEEEEKAVVDYILQNKNISKYEKVVLNNHLKSIEFRKEAVKRSQDKRKYFDSSKGVDLVNMYKIFIETDKETKIFEKFKTKFESLKKIII
jgi:hypothetical protein